jgi:hypothetical protein
VEDGATMGNFSEEYREAIEESLEAFVNNGDDVACIGYYILCYSHCRMCGHTPIKWHYILENLRTHQSLIVGSECVTNYQTILREWGYKPEYIVFPKCLKAYARWIIAKNPDAVVYNDGLVMRMKTDCNSIITATRQSRQLEGYGYVKPMTVRGVGALQLMQERNVTESHEETNDSDDSIGEILF